MCVKSGPAICLLWFYFRDMNYSKVAEMSNGLELGLNVTGPAREIMRL